MTATAQHRILVIKLGALGDFIQALGPMNSIRRHHPGAHITLLTTPAFKDMALKSGYFNEVWTNGRPALTGLPALIIKMNAAGFERVYDLQNNDRTALYFKLLWPLGKPEWVGVAPGASHRNASSERTAGHAFEGHRQTLALAGITGIEIDNLSWLGADSAVPGVNKPCALLVPGSSPARPEKRWPAARYADLACFLAEQGIQPVVLGSGSETELGEIIKERCADALDLTGKTGLADLPALARGARAAIGNDTGPMHLIAATGCPCLTLFSGFSNPERHAPQGPNTAYLYSENLQNLATETVCEELMDLISR